MPDPPASCGIPRGLAQRLRVAAYVVCTDDAGRMLLARWTGHGGPQWTLPGGGIEIGEQPAAAALRELTEETGYVGEPDAIVGVDSDRMLGNLGDDFYAVRIVYRGHVVSGSLTYEQDGTTDQAAWLSADDLAALDAVPLVDVGRRLATQPGRPVEVPGAGAVEAATADISATLSVEVIARDGDGRVVLVPSVPGEPGTWRRPRAVIEHGEPLERAVRRAVADDAGLVARPGAVVNAVSTMTEDADGRPVWNILFTFEAELG